MKHIILMEVILEDNYAIIRLDGERLKETWAESYCEYCSEVADVLEVIFKKIKDEPVTFIKKEYNLWEDYNAEHPDECEEYEED